MGNEASMGDELGIETSLRRPCEPAPAPAPAAGLFEVSRSLISTGMWDGCCAVVVVDVDDERGCEEAWGWPAPDVSMLLLAEVLLVSEQSGCEMLGLAGRFIGNCMGGYGLAPLYCRLNAGEQSINKQTGRSKGD